MAISRVYSRALLFVGCFTSQHTASVSQGRIYSDSSTCCHTEVDIADQIVYFTQSQYTDTGPDSPSVDRTMSYVWQSRHHNVHFKLISDDSQKLSVMIGTLLYIFGSCGRHSELTEEMNISLRPTLKEDSSSLMFLYTGQVTEIGRPKYLTHGR